MLEPLVVKEQIIKSATEVACMLSALVNMIRSGEAYVNVHTTQNQNGEVRGQISKTSKHHIFLSFLYPHLVHRLYLIEVTFHIC